MAGTLTAGIAIPLICNQNPCKNFSASYTLQGVTSSVYPAENLGDFVQTLFLHGRTDQGALRHKLALFLYCLLDRQGGAAGQKLNLASFRYKIAAACVLCCLSAIVWAQMAGCRWVGAVKGLLFAHCFWPHTFPPRPA